MQKKIKERDIDIEKIYGNITTCYITKEKRINTISAGSNFGIEHIPCFLYFGNQLPVVIVYVGGILLLYYISTIESLQQPRSNMMLLPGMLGSCCLMLKSRYSIYPVRCVLFKSSNLPHVPVIHNKRLFSAQ